MVAEGALAPKVLIFNPRSGPDAGIGAALRLAFPEHLVLELSEGQDLGRAIASAADDAEVVVAGGDGTVGGAVRALAGSRRVLGIVPTGTFNNFAGGLGLPSRLEDAVEVVRRGRAAWVGLGAVNGNPFVEAAGVGFFGEALLVGEAAKERRAGELFEHLAHLAGRRPFDYRLQGDLVEVGRATSIIVANTPTVGAGIDVGGSSPAAPGLQLAVVRPPRRAKAALRLLVAVARRRVSGAAAVRRVGRVAVEAEPPAPIFADTFELGTTPAVFESLPRALRVILPP
ncbi:MAG: diacylglycerol/lipid kinase family protein [Candidatus Dormibacterales bacterium]